MSRYPRTPIATKPTRRRSSYLLHHDFVRLDDWCHKVRELVGDIPYHVGSSTQRDGWRDVDLRVIMADDDFDRQYAGQPAKLHYTASLLDFSARIIHTGGVVALSDHHCEIITDGPGTRC